MSDEFVNYVDQSNNSSNFKKTQSLKDLGIKKIIDLKKENKIKLKKNIRKTRFVNSPLRVIVISFLSVIILGTLLLCMPFSSKNGQFTNVIDSFFTATSATCVTGLIIADTFTKWTVFGQIVILCLIQIGGLGLVTLVTFFNVAIGRRLGLKNMQLAQESISCPSFGEINSIIKKVVAISLLIELIGAVLLSFSFTKDYGSNGIFISIFLAISAFCNAGFDILGFQGEFSSLVNYNNSPYVVIIISLLIILGGLGFLVWNDLVTYKKGKRLMFHTKVVLITTGCLLIIGTLFFLFCEWNNPKTLASLDGGEKVLASFFQSVTCRTAGFNTIDQGGLTGVGKVVSIVLMFIGAAPGSTGGGIKVTTIIVIIMTVVCAVRGEDGTLLAKRSINQKTINRSVAIVFCAISVICITSMIVYFTNDPSKGIGGADAFFESTSAFATVGLSTGITPSLNVASKLALSLTMFIGRVGPISLLFSLIMRQIPQTKNSVKPEANILVG